MLIVEQHKGFPNISAGPFGPAKTAASLSRGEGSAAN